MNVLADDHEHHSVRFARSGIDRFAGVRWTSGPFGAPILDGVAAWVGATLKHEYDGGDHTTRRRPCPRTGVDPARAPLLFHRDDTDGWTFGEPTMVRAFRLLSHQFGCFGQRGASGHCPDVTSPPVVVRLFTQRRWIDCCLVTADLCRRG